MRCKNCHYSLERLTEHRCPECGREFDPDDPATYDDPSMPADTDRASLVTAIWLIGVACCFGLRWIGTALAARHHGWGMGEMVGLASMILIPLTIIAWHVRRTATMLPLCVVCLVIGLDLWVLWDSLAGREALYVAKAVRLNCGWVYVWFLAWFAWQVLLLPSLVIHTTRSVHRHVSRSASSMSLR